MHAKPDLSVFLKWMIADSGSVITDAIPLKQLMGISKKKRCTFQHSGRDFTWWVENESFIRIISEDRRFYVDYLIVSTIHTDRQFRHQDSPGINALNAYT